MTHLSPYEAGYNEQLEKLGLAMPGFLKNLGTKAKSMYFGKPSVATAPTPPALSTTQTSSNYTKAKDLFYNKKDVGFGKGQFGPVDMGSRGAQMDFQKKLMAVPAGTSSSGMPLPSGKEMHEKSQQALKQIQEMRTAKGQRPLQSQSREGQKEFASFNQKQRMKGIMGAHDAPATPQSGFFDDWGSVAPQSQTVPGKGWVNQPGNNMPTMQPSMVNAPTKVGYDQTLTALGIQGTTKEAFLEGVARKAGDLFQRAKGRSQGFVSQRRSILDQAKKKGEKDTLEALKVKKGLKEAPTPTPTPEAPTPESLKTETPESVEGEPSIMDGIKNWWGKRSPIAKAGIGAAAAAPIAYGLYQLGGDEHTPQNIDPVYPHQ